MLNLKLTPSTWLGALVPTAAAAKSPQLYPILSDPWTVAYQAPLSMGFSRQEYWSGLLCPIPGELPNPKIEPKSPVLAGEFFTTSATWEAPGRGSSSPS